MALKIKYFLIVILGISLSSPVSATIILSPKTNDTHYNHLHNINKQWEKHADYAPKKRINFESDADRIQSHLKLVISYLVEHTNSDLNVNQKNNRMHLLQELAKYANEKVFPINTKYNHRQPCFVDEKETHCAVGHMMAVSGHTYLVENIRSEYNYDYLQDIKTNGVTEWAIKYGFTLDELMWIQPGYPPTEQYDMLGEGTNGTVSYMNRRYGAGTGFLFSGDFTLVDGMDCLNIGIYQDNTLSCIGDGIAGTVNGIFNDADNYIVYGALIHEGVTYPIAQFNGSEWTYLSIPSREGAIASAGSRSSFGYEIILSINHSDVEGQEIWYLQNDGVWVLKASIDGTIYAISKNSLGEVFAGSFSSTATINEEGGIDLNIANNVMLKKHSSDVWTILNQPISDTVKCIEELGSAIYFGGSASLVSESDICLSRYYLGVISPLKKRTSFLGASYVSINAIEYYKDAQFAIGGDFYIYPEGIGTFGGSLAYYDLISNGIRPIALFDKPVSSIFKTSYGLYIGGEFTTDPGDNDYNHLVKLRITADLPEFISKAQIEIFPNPFVHSIQVKGHSDIKTFQVFNQAGQIIKQGAVENQSIQQLENLPIGNYILVLRSETEEWHVKLVK